MTKKKKEMDSWTKEDVWTMEDVKASYSSYSTLLRGWEGEGARSHAEALRAYIERKAPAVLLDVRETGGVLRLHNRKQPNEVIRLNFTQLGSVLHEIARHSNFGDTK